MANRLSGFLKGWRTGIVFHAKATPVPWKRKDGEAMSIRWDLSEKNGTDNFSRRVIEAEPVA